MGQPDFTPSHYQQAIFDFVVEQLRNRANNLPFRHLVVEASAGSGKSRSILECIKRLPPSAHSLVVAFNTRVADEMKSKLQGNARASTLHSLGLKAWSRFLGAATRPEIVADKVYKLIDAEIKAGTVSRYARFKTAKLVDLMRQIGVAVEDSAVNDTLKLKPLAQDSDSLLKDLMRRHDLGDDASIMRYARHVLNLSTRWGHRFVDFADMLYLPTLCGAPFNADADVVFVDECQDLDALQRQMILSMAVSGCMLVCVGDLHQAIYSFRGADSDSMRKVEAATSAVRLPLSITYRCPTSHVRLAQRVCATIEAAPGAVAGLLHRLDSTGRVVCTTPHLHSIDCICAPSLSRPSFLPGDVVICRQKAPLVKAAYSLIRNRIPARILGKDIGRGLVAFVDAQKARGIADLLRRVDAAVARELARCGSEDSAAEDDAQEIQDRRDVICSIADSCSTDGIEELRDRLVSLFADDIDRKSVVVFSTIHAFKGSEADRVWWLDDHKLNLDKQFKQEWKREEMRNLIFVASTRSRRELRLLPSAYFERK